ncbi:MAG: MBL fold metallo-hydrolase [Phycisphaerae bacterium]|nr:MBL fold metallo-hydrolase [Phycisphaerae bacterium]
MLLIALLLAFVACNACHSIREAPMSTHLPPPQRDSVTYVGHATVLLRLGGTTVITDPIYSEYVAFYRRYVHPGVPLEELPDLDVILISHGHWDHLDKSTLKLLDKDIVVIVPDGLQRSITGLGFTDVRGLKEWQTTTVHETTVTAVPARHSRVSCGYLIHNGKTVYFAGDTGLFDEMKRIGETRAIDLALLPIGGYQPHISFVPGLTGAMRGRHMAPADVPVAIEMLDSTLVVPIHWGTFALTGEPIDEPPEQMRQVIKQQGLEDKVRILLQGESIGF